MIDLYRMKIRIIQLYNLRNVGIKKSKNLRDYSDGNKKKEVLLPFVWVE